MTPRSTGVVTWLPFRSATTSSSVPIYWMSRSMLGFHWKRLSGYIPPRRISYISSDSLRVSFTSVGCRRFCTCRGSRLPGHPLPAEASRSEERRVGSDWSSDVCSSDLLVYFLGFSPGFVYLGGLPEVLHMPRLATPRPSIAGGSVGIAGGQTGIYPVDSPGGWKLIGRTPLRMFDPEATPPTRLQPGDRMKFSPIDRVTFEQTARRAEARLT